MADVGDGQRRIRPRRRSKRCRRRWPRACCAAQPLSVGAQPEAVHLNRVLASLGKRRTRVAVPGGVVVIDAERVIVARRACGRRQRRGSAETTAAQSPAGPAPANGRSRRRVSSGMPSGRAIPSLRCSTSTPSTGRSIVRSRKPGDRMRPLGLGGSKKLQDILVDAKVPAERARRRARHRRPARHRLGRRPLHRRARSRRREDAPGDAIAGAPEIFALTGSCSGVLT